MAKYSSGRYGPAFRARRGKQGIGAWDAEQHHAHNLNRKMPKGNGKMRRRIARGGFPS